MFLNKYRENKEFKKIKKNLKKLINKKYKGVDSNSALNKMLLDINRAYDGFIYGMKNENDGGISLCMQKSCLKDYGDKNNYFTYQIKKYENSYYNDKNFYIYYTIDKVIDKQGYKNFSIKDFEFIFR